MILADSRAGSSGLVPYIQRLTNEVILTTMEFGDFAWAGYGPSGSTLNVGVEYKTIDDALTCMVDGRFVGHQLPGLLQSYDRIYLLVEGRTRVDRNTGIVQKLRGERWLDIHRAGRMFTYRDLLHWYTTIEEQTQVRVVETYDEYMSSRWLVTKHTWYTNKGWDDHKSLQQFHVPPPPAASLVKPGLVRRVAKELPLVGWGKSAAVEARFATVREMVCASPKDWQNIDGVGKEISNRIVKALTTPNQQ